jgi:glycerate 2-kinase
MLATLQRVVCSTLQAADPRLAFRASASQSVGRTLSLCGGATVDLSAAPCALILGAGKASVGVACELSLALSRLDPPLPIHGGVIVTKDGHAAARDAAALAGVGVAVREAAHPVPDGRGEAAARELLACVSGAPRGAAVFVCLSGGASALMPLPPPGVALADLAALSVALLASGAPIQDLNTVRKHVSVVAGGQLGAAAAARTDGGALVTLVCSDVVGDALHVVGSGPTVPDPTTHGDALQVLEARGLLGGAAAGVTAPAAVVDHLRRGAAGLVPETRKAPLPFHAVATLCSNTSATAAAAAALSTSGFEPHVLTNSLEGGAAAAGALLGTLLAEAALGRGPFAPGGGGGGGSARRGVALVLGGETTVVLPPGCAGRGGRNQELALAAAARAGDLLSAAAAAGAAARGAPPPPPAPWLLCALATDGTDGPTDAAGAVVTSETLAAAAAKALHVEGALRGHDAYAILDALGGGASAEGASPAEPRVPGREGGLLFTGPTGTNVCDVTVVMIAAPGEGL